MGEALSKLPLARPGLAFIALGLLFGGLLSLQTPVESAPRSPFIPPDTDGRFP